MTSITGSFLVPGKVALITGGGSGIGREIALVLAAAGARVIATDISEDGLRETTSLAASCGVEVETHLLDVSDPDAISSTIDDVVERHGALDILVNSAGVMIMRDALDVTPEELDRVMRVNLGGTFFACQSAAKVMKRGSRIVNIASAIIDRPSVSRITYAMSKGAVHQLTRALALELGPAGITVNAIAPGWVETAITKQHWTAADGTVDEQKKISYIASKASASPLGTVGTPRDIALTALQLTSDAGSFITGQVVRVNGGSNMV